MMTWLAPPVDPQTAASLPPRVLAELGQGTDWVGTWWPAVALAVVAVALGVLSSRRSRRTWPTVAFAVVLMTGAAAAGVNAGFGYLPNVGAAAFMVTGSISGTGARPGGRVAAETVDVPADLRVPVSTTWVYTPPGYDPNAATRYPVVYLVHGQPGISSDWITGGDIAHVMDVLIAHRLVQPMIVVAPNVNAGGIGGIAGLGETECLDSSRGGPQVETYLDDVVVPWIDAHYRTAADWQHRVIGGMSAGGYCALDQGLRHPELYGAIIALEPYDNPGAGGRAMLSTQAEYDAHSPGTYLPSTAFQHPVPTFLDVGENGTGGDPGDMQAIAATLAARGQPLLFREEPGQRHTWTMARTGIPYGLVFVSQHIPRP